LVVGYSLCDQPVWVALAQYNQAVVMQKKKRYEEGGKRQTDERADSGRPHYAKESLRLEHTSPENRCSNCSEKQDRKDDDPPSLRQNLGHEHPFDLRECAL
jgi:hypothetical protein